jgi:hypothetical protein
VVHGRERRRPDCPHCLRSGGLRSGGLPQNESGSCDDQPVRRRGRDAYCRSGVCDDLRHAAERSFPFRGTAIITVSCRRSQNAHDDSRVRGRWQTHLQHNPHDDSRVRGRWQTHHQHNPRDSHQHSPRDSHLEHSPRDDLRVWARWQPHLYGRLRLCMGATGHTWSAHLRTREADEDPPKRARGDTGGHWERSAGSDLGVRAHAKRARGDMGSAPQL